MASRIVERVPGPLALYVRVSLLGRGPCDIDLVLFAGASLFVVGVTSIAVGAFDRDRNILTGHRGAGRQVRQLATSTAHIAGSAVGRTAHLRGVQIRPVLCLAGDRTPALVDAPRFDLVTISDVAQARILSVAAADLVGYVIGTVLAAGSDDGAIQSLRRSFERHVLAACAYALEKPATSMSSAPRPVSFDPSA